MLLSLLDLRSLKFSILLCTFFIEGNIYYVVGEFSIDLCGSGLILLENGCSDARGGTSFNYKEPREAKESR